MTDLCSEQEKLLDLLVHSQNENEKLKATYLDVVEKNRHLVEVVNVLSTRIKELEKLKEE